MFHQKSSCYLWFLCETMGIFRYQLPAASIAWAIKSPRRDPRRPGTVCLMWETPSEKSPLGEGDFCHQKIRYEEKKGHGLGWFFFYLEEVDEINLVDEHVDVGCSEFFETIPEIWLEILIWGFFAPNFEARKLAPPGFFQGGFLAGHRIWGSITDNLKKTKGRISLSPPRTENFFTVQKSRCFLLKIIGLPKF